METIRNYLDHMFLSLPDTEEVRKAKDELLQMMEDKYFELKEQGKTENEAIGIVIAEFGNLEEIKEELQTEGFYESVKDTGAGQQAPEKRISLRDAMDYMDKMKKYSYRIALGTMLCIFSPVMLIFSAGISEAGYVKEDPAIFAGLMFLFLMIIVAVPIFIYNGNQMEDYEYLKKEIFQIDGGTERCVREERDRNKANHSVKLIIGVVLCIFSVIPLLWSAFFLGDVACIFSTCILLVIIGISMLFLIPAGMQMDSYKVLLQEGDYNVKTKEMETISTIYWCVVIAIYLGWSFITFGWAYTWIIWPIAGVLYGAVTAAYRGVKRR